MCAKAPAAGVFTLKSAAHESPGQVFDALGEPGSLKGIYPERVAAGRARCPGGKARRCPATLHQSRRFFEQLELRNDLLDLGEVPIVVPDFEVVFESDGRNEGVRER